MKKWRHGDVTFLVQGAAVRWWQDQYYTVGPCGAKALTLSLCADCLSASTAQPQRTTSATWRTSVLSVSKFKL